jgi:hypothetical protein
MLANPGQSMIFAQTLRVCREGTACPRATTRWVGTDFPSRQTRSVCARRSYLNKKIEPDDDLKKSHPALVPRSREYDVGGDREPEGVIADNLYLDEHANDRKDHQHERKHKPKVHCAYLLALRRNAKNLAWSIATVNVRDVVASSKATSELCGPRTCFLTRNSRAPSLVVLE